MEIGFEVAGESPTGKQHRWVRGGASIDVLIPNGVGEQALRRSERVEVDMAGQRGAIWRPNLVGALIAKAAAHTVPADHHKGRHRSDFATLAAMVSRKDLIDQTLSRRETIYLRSMVANVLADPTATEGDQDAVDGLRRLEILVS